MPFDLYLFQPTFSCPVFEEPEDPSNRSFFSEIISSISDVKFSHNGRYMMTRDYLSVKIWDLNMENRPVETYQVRLTKTLAISCHYSTLQHRQCLCITPFELKLEQNFVFLLIQHLHFGERLSPC